MKIKASPYTQLFWDEYQLNKNRNDYNITFDQTITGDFSIEKLNTALSCLIKQNILLNSHLIEDSGKLYWVENDHIDNIQIFNDPKYQSNFISTPFKLEIGPLYRFGVFKISENKYDLIIVLHHAIIDGSSVDQFISFISNFYNDEQNLTELKSQANKIQNTNKLLSANINLLENNGADIYWKNLLTEMPPKCNIPYIKSNDDGIGEYRFYYNLDPSTRLIIKTHKTTLFTFLISIFGFMMTRYCNSDSIAIAYPISIKEGSDLIFGAQINTALFPINISETSSLDSLISSSNTYIKSLKINSKLKFSYYPVRDIILHSKLSSLNISFAQTNLKDTLLNFNNCSTTINKRYNIDIASSELVLEYSEYKGDIQFRIKYKKSLFNQQYIQQIAMEYINLLNTFLKEKYNPREPLNKVSLLTKDEYQKVILDFNRTYKKYPDNKKINHLFEEQVQKTPHNIALIFNDQKLTYKELNAKSNQLARYIRKQYKQITKQELKPDTLIPLCLERSLDMIIGILAIMKTGGAYVPMDPNYPENRFKHIFTDINAKLVITQNHLESKLRNITEEIAINIKLISINPDQNDNYIYSQEDDNNLESQGNSTDLAYVIYTSGTTGLPKGVLIEHRNISQTLYSNNFINKKIIGCMWTSYAFDVSVYEIFSNICFGNQLHIIEEKTRLDYNTYFEYIRKNNIEVSYIPPFYIKYLNYYLTKNILSLKKILTGVDKIYSNDIKNILSNNITVLNAYGPTETTICSTSILLKEEYKKDILPIGKPLSNEKVYVLDKSLQPLPVGVVGELYIGGDGVARGYLNQPDLTSEKFIDNPFATEEDKSKGYTKLYKTGDLVKWLEDGNLEYIGRNDFQVKINGYRIELGEIENQLSKLPGVKQSCVLTKENKNTKNIYLVGYYVPEKLNSLNQEDLLNQLSDKLPEYMVPNVLVEITNLPLTSNGKLDKKALPTPNIINEDNYIAPTTKLEKQICRIWEEVLRLDKIGINDNFFRIGGSSLLSILIIRKLHELNINISISDIYRLKTISKICQNINSSTLVKQLSFSNKNENKAYFVHSAGCGCEVYQKIVESIYDQYDCYGVDNYLLSNAYQIVNKDIPLSKLAERYLFEIGLESLQKEKNVVFIGWSLGGHIALEMAYQLEKITDKTQIHVILIDSILPDNKLNSFYESNFNMVYQGLEDYINSKDFDHTYANNLRKAFSNEISIGKTYISGILERTKIILLKATHARKRGNDLAELDNYIANLSDNNIQAFSKQKLHIEDLPCHHGNIMQFLESNITKNELKRLFSINN